MLNTEQRKAAILLEKFRNPLEDCFKTSKLFGWDVRDFIVDIGMIDNFISIHQRVANANDHVCSDLRNHGESSHFVLYNIWCQQSSNSSAVSLQHYYQEEY